MLQEDKKNNYYESGMSAFIKKDYISSIDYFTKAMDLDTKSYRVLVSRGAAYLQAERIDNAMEDFNKAILLRPTHAQAYHMRALAFDKQGELESALIDLKRAVELDPEYGAAFRSKAMVLDKIGHSDDAVEDMRMANHLTELNLARFNHENNVWQSQHLKLEAEEIVSELER